MLYPSALLYPGAKVTSGGSGIFEGPPPRYADCNFHATTKDDVPSVMRFYSGKAEQVIDLAPGRPYTLKLMLHRCMAATLVVVVSRIPGETLTDIGVLYDTHGQQADLPQPVDWTYPATRSGDFTSLWQYYTEKAAALRTYFPGGQSHGR
jgi:hypothetical protein